MSEEELNKKMEFIVEWQAKFAADMEMEREARLANAKLFHEQHRNLTDNLIGVMDIVRSLARHQLSTDDRVNVLEESMTRLAQAQAETAQSLKSLINAVERHLGGNGGLQTA